MVGKHVLHSELDKRKIYANLLDKKEKQLKNRYSTDAHHDDVNNSFGGSKEISK